MKKTTMVKLGCAMVYGTMGLTNGDGFIAGSISGYIIASIGVAIYNKFKKPYDTTQYNKNLAEIKAGTKKPYKTSYYSKNDTYYYKELADIFGFTQNEMITVLRKYIIKGKYPNVELRNSDWGEYKLTADGKRVYIEYNAECIEYLKVMLAK